MVENMQRKLEHQEQAMKGLLVRVVVLTKALKDYRDQHQATGCSCALCKQAERALRTIEGTE